MRHPIALITTLVTASLLAAACSSDTTTAETVDTSGIADGTSATFIAEVWVDNWFSLTVNGEFVGEDSVPITTERSFNAETFTFEATYPLTVAVEAKDFKETDSGLEYIGENNQQMGDGGLILQITDQDTGGDRRRLVRPMADACHPRSAAEQGLRKLCRPRQRLREPDHRCPGRLDRRRLRRLGLVQCHRLVVVRRWTEGWLRRDLVELVRAADLGNGPRVRQHRTGALHRRGLTGQCWRPDMETWRML